MTKKSEALKALSKMSRADPQVEDIRQIENELFTIGSDRTTAIILGSSVEKNLGRMLISAMRPDLNSDDKAVIFGDRGISGTFSAKTMTAWAFNLIGPIVRTDLNIIREVRNVAAHSRMTFSFNEEIVANACQQLAVPNLRGTYIPFNYLERLVPEERTKAETLDYPKTRFVTACHFISYRMYQKINGPQAGDIAFDVLLP